MQWIYPMLLLSFRKETYVDKFAKTE